MRSFVHIKSGNESIKVRMAMQTNLEEVKIKFRI